MSVFRDGYIYKLTGAAQWAAISKGEHFPYSEVDGHDGFFHMSTPAQILETAHRHYLDHERICAVGCPEGAPGDLLKWEVSAGRQGQKFPHVYGDVLVSWFDHVVPLIRQGDQFVPSEDACE